MRTFRESLEIGKMGELLMTGHFPNLTALNGKHSDFVDKNTGELYELKTDTYNINATPNFFIERYSNEGKKSPGSVWQAAEHGSTFFMYFYIRNHKLFLFKTAPLLERLELIIPKFIPIGIPNKNYVTIGYKIPRIILNDLYEEIEI